MKAACRHASLLSLILLVILTLTSCQSLSPTVPVPATPTQALPAVTPGAAPTTTPTAAPTLSASSLANTLATGLPQDAFEGVKALPLNVAPGQRPLWAVYSYGLRNFDLTPLPDHFLAIYTQDKGKWQELARQTFSADDVAVAAPDYLGEDAVAQVQIEPGHIWLQVEGGVGAHGGVFDLLSFADNQLKVELNAWAPSPGVGRIQDVNGDGRPDVVIDATDRYVFCYACSVAKIMYVIYTWDEANKAISEVPLQEMLMGQSGHPGRATNNDAVLLARAGLWKDALAKVTAAKTVSTDVKPPFSNEALNWNYGIIKLFATAMASNAHDSGYPLLSEVFYGDYKAALDLLRPYTPDKLFSATTPLIVGTVAENWTPQVAQHITDSVALALQANPDLAEAYFLRGWANYLVDPIKLLPQVKADVAKAAALAPNDTLYKQAVAFLAKPSPTAKQPAAVPTAQPTVPAPQAKRIQFAAGATSTEVKGQLAAGKIEEYVLRAQAGQWMLVNVLSPKSDVLLAITGLNDGQPYLRSAAGASNWQGPLKVTQDYSIKVVSVGAATPYTLLVTIPARITFKPGATSATVDGKLAASRQNEYVLRALKGQKMTVTIQSPRSDVLLEIYGFEDGQPLVRVPMGAATWTGILPATQDYSIKAVSVGGPTSYKMAISIK